MDKENKVINLEEAENKAAVEAASDMSAQTADANAKDINKRIPYTIQLSKTYRLDDGTEVKEVDLSGLEDLTTADAEYVDRVMAKMNYSPKNKFKDITYTKHIAMRVTNLPIEFFNSLKWKDMESIASRITIYFLY